MTTKGNGIMITVTREGTRPVTTIKLPSGVVVVPLERREKVRKPCLKH